MGLYILGEHLCIDIHIDVDINSIRDQVRINPFHSVDAETEVQRQ